MKVTDFIMILFLAVLAQAATDYGPLAQFGALGIVLAWFMLRCEKLLANGALSMTAELSKLTGRIDGLTRAMLMDLVSRDSVGLHTKAQAREMIAEIEAGKK